MTNQEKDRSKVLAVVFFLTFLFFMIESIPVRFEYYVYESITNRYIGDWEMPS